ncbi:MAG: S8 family serine peptidase [Pseudomonadota bacterium]
MKNWLCALLLALSIGPAIGAEEVQQVMVMLHLPAPHFRADAGYGGAYRDEGGRSARRRIAQELAATHGLTLVSDWPMPVLGIDCFVLALPADADVAAITAALAKDKRVEWVQPVSTFHGLGTGDPLYPVQPAKALWHLDELHQATTGRTATVAIIDSGVDDQHPDLKGQVLVRENFIDASPFVAENHGTAVAGIIAAHADNGIGIRGVAPGAHLLALRACRELAGQAAQCDSYSLGKALHFAIMREPTIINLSLTGPPDRLLQRLLDVALARGIRVVGAFDGQTRDGGFPASWPGVVGVSERMAPGRDIPVTLPGGRFGVLTGSSFAAAHTSGLLALLRQLQPSASVEGAIDACASVGKAAGHCVCACTK